MYLRHKRIPKNGKTHAYWLLVRSVRRGGKVRQEVVATLGKLLAKGRSRARAYPNTLTGRRMEPSLFEPRDESEVDVAAVHLKAVRIERSRRFGAVVVNESETADSRTPERASPRKLKGLDVPILPPLRSPARW